MKLLSLQLTVHDAESERERERKREREREREREEGEGRGDRRDENSEKGNTNISRVPEYIFRLIKEKLQCYIGIKCEGEFSGRKRDVR